MKSRLNSVWDKSKETLHALQHPVFRPLPPFRKGWMQTLLGRWFPQAADLLPDQEHRVMVSHGDQLLLIENSSQDWKAGQRIFVLIHGLSGSHESLYCIRMNRRLLELGYKVIRVNLRGAGVGSGLAKRPYHAGISEDLRAVIQYLSKLYPSSPITQIAYSLGANISLKMAGEDGSQSNGNLDSMIVASPPIDLAASAKKLQKPANKLFDYYFVAALRAEMERLKRQMAELADVEIPRNMSMEEFDNLYTAPLSGFKDAADYYQQSSSEAFIPEIKLPCLFLAAVDDPVVDTEAYFRMQRPPQMDLCLAPHGGHVGFISAAKTPLGDRRWMDSIMIRWIEQKILSS